MPTRDEARRLPRTLRAIAAFAADAGYRVEVILADDGSRDGTRELGARLARELGLRLVVLGPSLGVGRAVRRGMLAARGRRVLLCDADGAVPFADLDQLWDALDAGCDVAVGSRRPGLLDAPRPLHRLVMGRVWSHLVRRSATTDVRDTQCGFKLFTWGASQRIFARTLSRSFAFHVEALAVAEQLGLAVREVGVRWRDVPGSKVRLTREPLHMLLDLARLAVRQRPSSRQVAPATRPIPVSGSGEGRRSAPPAAAGS